MVDADSAVDRLREAVGVFERSEARLEHARALVELGSVLRRSGYRTDAPARLRTGLELAYACGARSLAERARHELLAMGSRPRRPPGAGLYTLTASELRIARMAAEGLSNREIAQSLYLSLKTVEMHLGHAYDKLGIHSRTRLAARLNG
jgi:DNA-binding NarL/FixJ family response regulator